VLGVFGVGGLIVILIWLFRRLCFDDKGRVLLPVVLALFALRYIAVQIL